MRASRLISRFVLSMSPIVRRFLLVLFPLALALAGCDRGNPNAVTTASPPAPPATTGPGTSGTGTNAAPNGNPPTPSPVIVKDLFQEDINAQEYQNINLVGTKPKPVDLPGVAWQMATGDGTYEMLLTSPGEMGCLAYLNCAASAALNLASNGAYVKPKVMTLSGDLSFNTDLGTSATGFAVLGFYSALSGEHTGNVLANFTGLVLFEDGSVQLVEKGTLAGTPVKFTGKYDSVQPATLTYSIDTVTGAISNISLAGSKSTYAFKTAAFTPEATAYVGIGVGGRAIVNATGLQLSAGVGPTSVPTDDSAASPTNAP